MTLSQFTEAEQILKRWNELNDLKSKFTRYRIHVRFEVEIRTGNDTTFETLMSLNDKESDECKDFISNITSKIDEEIKQLTKQFETL